MIGELKITKLPDGYTIELFGDASRIPSTSNNKRAFYIPKLKRAIITHSAEHKKRLKFLTNLYVEEVLRMGMLPPHMPELVTIIVILGKQRVDSHNMPKPIGDWLEEIGVLDNDIYAEILPFKADEHPEWGVPTDRTTIHIMARASAAALHRGVHEIITRNTRDCAARV